jgi:hypothetical protein
MGLLVLALINSNSGLILVYFGAELHFCCRAQRVRGWSSGARKKLTLIIKEYWMVFHAGLCHPCMRDVARVLESVKSTSFGRFLNF